MVIVQFRGRLVRQYRACVIDSLGLGILRVLYHCTMCTRHPDLDFLCHPYILTLHLLVSSHFNHNS